jgi:hypothetical protein
MNHGLREDYLNLFKEASRNGKPFTWMGQKVFVTYSEINYLSEHIANYTFTLSDGNTVKFDYHRI